MITESAVSPASRIPTGRLTRVAPDCRQRDTQGPRVSARRQANSMECRLAVSPSRRCDIPARMKPVIPAFLLAFLLLVATASLRGQAAFTVTLVPPTHGKVHLAPTLAADSRYPAGTVVTVTTTPDPGYLLDSAWYSVPGRFGQMYHEGMGREFKVRIDQDKRIGASFIE